MGVQEVIFDIHPFKCGQCKGVRPHRLIKTYDCPDIPEAPGEVWLMECQGCFDHRIIYPTERVASKEDDIERCGECGNWKMISTKCRICKIAADQESIKIKYFTGHSDIKKEISIADL